MMSENLERWKGRFSMPDGTPPYERVEKEAKTAFPITIAEYRGTYALAVSGLGAMLLQSPGHGAPRSACADAALFPCTAGDY